MRGFVFQPLSIRVRILRTHETAKARRRTLCLRAERVRLQWKCEMRRRKEQA